LRSWLAGSCLVFWEYCWPCP